MTLGRRTAFGYLIEELAKYHHHRGDSIHVCPSHDPRILMNVTQHNIINLLEILAVCLFIILGYLVCTNLCVNLVDDSMVLKCTKVRRVYVKNTHSMIV